MESNVKCTVNKADLGLLLTCVVLAHPTFMHEQRDSTKRDGLVLLYINPMATTQTRINYCSSPRNMYV